ncbi:MAG: hypothetical protein R3Y63_04670 [Eubacteriales bacterium]
MSKEENLELSYLLGQFVAIGFLLEETCHLEEMAKTLYTEESMMYFFENLDKCFENYLDDLFHLRQEVKEKGKNKLVERLEMISNTLSVEAVKHLQVSKKSFLDGYYYEKDSNV